eukprot:gene18340-20184_t
MTVLTKNQEQDLAKYIIDMDNSFYRMSINGVQKVAFQFCERNNIPHPFSKVKQMAGRDFVAGFLKRQSTNSLRKPEAVSLNRGFGLDKTSMKRETLGSISYATSGKGGVVTTVVTCYNAAGY